MVTTTTMIQHLLIVLLVSCLDSQSANSQKISAKLNTNDKNDAPRKLKDNVEIITHSNMIVDDSPTNSKVAKPKSDIYGMAMDVDNTKEYQYFNDASEVSTPKYAHDLSSNYDLSKYETPKYESLQYEPPANYEPSTFQTPNIEPPNYGPPLPPLLPSIKIPSNFKIDEADLTQYYSQQFEPMPDSMYLPNDPLLGNEPIHAVPVSVPVPVTTHEMLPIIPATSISHKPLHTGPGHILKITHRPIWAPEVAKLESQYLETYRSIKSSVLNFYNKMHYFVNYFMSLFTFAEIAPYNPAQGRAGFGALGGGGGGGHGGHGGGGGGKLKFKKKYRKFLLPLLLAYKLKFFTLIPLLIGGLVLLVGATGMAGFFFALFAAVLSLKGTAHE